MRPTSHPRDLASRRAHSILAMVSISIWKGPKMTVSLSYRTVTLAAAALGLAILPSLAQEAATPTLEDKVVSGTYSMDPTHGYVTFSYNHLGFSNPQLRFRTVDAKLTLDAENPAASSVDVVIDATSIDSGVDVFDEHLNSTDWLDTATFPEITFASTGLTQIDETTGTLTGDLTMKGITKSVTLDVTLIGAGMHPIAQKDTVGIEARGTVLRSDFGVAAYAPAVSDEVHILISGEFNKTEEEISGS